VKLCIGNLKFGEMEFGEMKRNTSNWSNFCILLRRAGLSASAGLSCKLQFLADRTNGRAYATVLRPSVCRLSVCCLSSVTLCIVVERCVLEQKLLLTAHRKS